MESTTSDSDSGAHVSEIEGLRRKLDEERSKLFRVCNDLAARDMALLEETQQVRNDLNRTRAELADARARLARAEQTVAALRASTTRRVARRVKRMVSAKPA